jgi:hypothetical protein
LADYVAAMGFITYIPGRRSGGTGGGGWSIRPSITQLMAGTDESIPDNVFDRSAGSELHKVHPLLLLALRSNTIVRPCLKHSAAASGWRRHRVIFLRIRGRRSAEQKILG